MPAGRFHVLPHTVPTLLVARLRPVDYAPLFFFSMKHWVASPVAIFCGIENRPVVVIRIALALYSFKCEKGIAKSLAVVAIG